MPSGTVGQYQWAGLQDVVGRLLPKGLPLAAMDECLTTYVQQGGSCLENPTKKWRGGGLSLFVWGAGEFCAWVWHHSVQTWTCRSRARSSLLPLGLLSNAPRTIPRRPSSVQPDPQASPVRAKPRLCRRSPGWGIWAVLLGFIGWFNSKRCYAGLIQTIATAG